MSDEQRLAIKRALDAAVSKLANRRSAVPTEEGGDVPLDAFPWINGELVWVNANPGKYERLAVGRATRAYRPPVFICCQGAVSASSFLQERRMKTMFWVLKVSKFCNLRCSYCYEWDELNDRTVTSHELLKKILVGIRDYHEHLRGRFGEVVTSITWAGGEPLIMPDGYYEKVLELEQEIFGVEALKSRHIANVVQTNAYSLNDDMIRTLIRGRFDVGVSLDVVPGVRKSLGGHLTEQRVMKNVARLREVGFNPGAIVVIAKHTAGRMREVLDFFLENKFPSIRALPVYDGAPPVNEEAFGASNSELENALFDLFVHWYNRGMPIDIAPLNEYLAAVLRKMAKDRMRLYDRETDGEAVTIVNTNGDVYSFLDAYEPSKAMGNFANQSVFEIISSAKSRMAIERDRHLKDTMCGRCDYSGYCLGWPVLSTPQSGSFNGRCPLAFPVTARIESFLRERGTNEDLIQEFRNESRLHGPSPET